jgi:hypothetical protein
MDLTPALAYRRFFAELLSAYPEHITVNQRVRSFNSVTTVKFHAIIRTVLFVQG